MKKLLNNLYCIPWKAQKLNKILPLNTFEQEVYNKIKAGEAVECFMHDLATGEYFYTETYVDDFVEDWEIVAFAKGNHDHWVTKDGLKPYHWFNRFEHWLDFKTGNAIPLQD